MYHVSLIRIVLVAKAGKSSNVQIQIQIQPNFQIQIHSFKKAQIQSKSISNLLKICQIQIHLIWEKCLNPDLDLPAIG